MHTVALGAHLVGSVPLADAETVFRTVSKELGHHLDRLPDGETGVRKDWIAWQYPLLAQTRGLEPVPSGERVYLRRQLVRRVPGGPPPEFRSLGYADAALASFQVFERLQREGVIPRALSFQVSLPTPLAPVTVFVEPVDRASVEPAYESQMMEELERITEEIPHDRLSIQWDVAAEFGLLERVWPAHFDDVKGGVLARLERLGRAVPRDVGLGFHLCYGDFGHKHFTQPPDATLLVEVANALARLERPVDWLHLPVPQAWTEPGAFAPLGTLRLQAQTRLYLGVVHHADGLAGARQRIARASEWVRPFGVATECGWGRRPPEAVPELLRLHAELAAPVR